MARSLQQDLNRIAERADTSTPEGLSYVLTGKFSLCNCVNVDPFIDLVDIVNSQHVSLSMLNLWYMCVYSPKQYISLLHQLHI